ncbi:basic salivary proline-rich protein 4-like [Perognathus longimembris pacificus]|uniref:basic salivary proline-rich protein 4-like n=1 Tax=Perognathus longimembris pacificus TaxID=214514 RepID=UPI00201929F2|nr:basic salivary proline-rich protein 4-like [Perognathus longimembris pacificus]
MRPPTGVRGPCVRSPRTGRPRKAPPAPRAEAPARGPAHRRQKRPAGEPSSTTPPTIRGGHGHGHYPAAARVRESLRPRVRVPGGHGAQCRPPSAQATSGAEVRGDQACEVCVRGVGARLHPAGDSEDARSALTWEAQTLRRGRGPGPRHAQRGGPENPAFPPKRGAKRTENPELGGRGPRPREARRGRTAARDTPRPQAPGTAASVSAGNTRRRGKENAAPPLRRALTGE